MINSEQELQDYILDILTESGLLQYCGECAIRNDGACCRTLNPFGMRGTHCKYLGENGCTERNVDCLMYFCSKAQVNFPETMEQLDRLAAKIKYETLMKFPMEDENGN